MEPGITIQTKRDSYIQEAPSHVAELVKKGPRELKVFCSVKKNIMTSLIEDWKEEIHSQGSNIKLEKIDEFIESYKVLSDNTDLAIQAIQVFLGRKRYVNLACVQIEYGVFIAKILALAALVFSVGAMVLQIYASAVDPEEEIRRYLLQTVTGACFFTKIICDKFRESIFKAFNKEEKDIYTPLLTLLGSEEKDLSLLEDEYLMLSNLKSLIEESRRDGSEAPITPMDPLELQSSLIKPVNAKAVKDIYLISHLCGLYHTLNLEEVDYLIEDIIEVKMRLTTTLDYSHFLQGHRIPVLTGVISNLKRYKKTLEQKFPELQVIVDSPELEYSLSKKRSYIRMILDGCGGALVLINMVAHVESMQSLMRTIMLSVNAATLLMTSFDARLEKIQTDLERQKKWLVQANNEQNLLLIVQAAIETFSTYEDIRTGKVSNTEEAVRKARKISLGWAKVMCTLTDRLEEKKHKTSPVDEGQVSKDFYAALTPPEAVEKIASFRFPRAGPRSPVQEADLPNFDLPRRESVRTSVSDEFLPVGPLSQEKSAPLLLVAIPVARQALDSGGELYLSRQESHEPKGRVHHSNSSEDEEKRERLVTPQREKQTPMPNIAVSAVRNLSDSDRAHMRRLRTYDQKEPLRHPEHTREGLQHSGDSHSSEKKKASATKKQRASHMLLTLLSPKEGETVVEQTSLQEYNPLLRIDRVVRNKSRQPSVNVFAIQKGLRGGDILEKSVCTDKTL